MTEKVPYSKSEKKLLALLTTTPVKSTTLRRMYFAERKRVPRHAQQIIVGLAHALVVKTKRNRARMQVKELGRQGPHPTSYWLERCR